MSLLDEVLSRDEFKTQPLVLIDIGASGEIHKKWKKIAKHAYCIAFDADLRDFDTSGKNNKSYKKLFIKNALVGTQVSDVDFYLTRSPYCSSTLQPALNKLNSWAFAPLFEIEKTVQLKAVNLNSVLSELRIDYVDWYKSDSQGIDLRLFASLEPSIRDKVVVAEFEPGIIDAYEGEDKLHTILSYMDNIDKFWLSDLELKGTMKIPYTRLKEIFKNPFLQKLIAKVGRNSPGWGEMTYINHLNAEDTPVRQLLVGWVFSTLLNQHGFAYELACKGRETYQDRLFDKLRESSKDSIHRMLINSKYISLIKRRLI